MRLLGLLACVTTGCGFEAALAPGGAGPGTDASTPQPDASADAPPDAPAKVCAAAYVDVPAAQTQSKYRRVQVQTEWLDAEADCESDGGHLVIPETEAEAIAIHAFVDPLASSPYFWAGISDPEQDGEWLTVTGASFAIPAWGAGDPDQRDGEIYAIVYSNGDYYDWFDYGTQEYACECTP